MEIDPSSNQIIIMSVVHAIIDQGKITDIDQIVPAYFNLLERPDIQQQINEAKKKFGIV